MPNETRGECPPRIDYRFSYSFAFEQDLDDVAITAWIQRYWHFTIAISLIYLGLVKALEFAMRDRKPINLGHQLTLWNAALAAFSIFG
jgi:hypothetical protein